MDRADVTDQCQIHTMSGHTIIMAVDGVYVLYLLLLVDVCDLRACLKAVPQTV